MKQFICDFCGKVFIKRSLLLRHFIIHNKAAASYRCPQCSQWFGQKVSLQKHLKNFVCEKRALKAVNTAPSSPETSTDIAQELGCEHNNICIFCYKSFLKPSDLERHIRTHTNERNFKCHNCSKSFKLKNTLERHLKTHVKRTFTCSICSSNYKSEKVLLNHMKSHSRRQTFQVLLSPQLSHSRNVLAEAVNEEIIDNEPSDLLCDADESFLPQHSAEKEMNHVEISGEQSEEKIDGTKETFITPQKPKSSKEHVCGTCRKSFKKPIDLRRHSDAVHDKKRPFMCLTAKCAKSFSLKCTLNRHMETHRKNRQLMSCDVCDKVLSSSSSFKLHKRMHEESKAL